MSGYVYEAKRIRIISELYQAVKCFLS